MPGKIIHRRKGESIRIGDAITVTVEKTGHGKTTLRVEAPPDVAIHKGEDVPPKLTTEAKTA